MFPKHRIHTVVWESASICNTIVQAHGGQIAAHNHAHGAEFLFTLPKGDI